MTNANTPDPSTQVDVESGVSDHIRSTAAAAEDEVLLSQLFGLQIPRNLADGQVDAVAQNLAQRVGTRIATNVDQTRHAFNQAQLTGVLNQRITAALRRVVPGAQNTLGTITDTLYHQRVRAVAEAIRESLPKGLLLDYVQYGLPAALSETSDVPDGQMRVNCAIDGANRTVQIDLRHTFWRETVFADRNALRDALKARPVAQRTLAVLGISITNPPLAENYALTDADIDAITDPGTQASMLDLSRSYRNITQRINVPALGRDVDFVVDTANLVRYRFPAGHPTYPGQLVASLTEMELAAELAVNNSVLWTSYIAHPGEEDQVDATNLICAQLATRIFNELGSNPFNALALRDQDVYGVQNEMSEQHRFFTRLREGSENYTGAAIAGAILMRHKDIRDVIDVRGEAAVRRDLTAEQYRKTIVDALAQADSLRPTTAMTYDQAINVQGNWGPTLALIPGGGTLILGGQTYVMSGTSPADRQAAQQWVSQMKNEADKAANEYRKIENVFRSVALAAANLRNNTTTLAIFNYFNIGGPPYVINAVNTAQFISTMDVRGILEEVRTDPAAGNIQDSDQHKQRIQVLQKELQDILAGNRSGGLSGDTAQHAVIKEYLRRYHGSTEQEANAAANFVRARSYVDAELSSAAEDISNDLYGQNVTGWERAGNWFNKLRHLSAGSPETRAQKILTSVAQSCGVSMTGDMPQWRATKRPDALITAYFSLKKLHEGTAGSKAIHIQKTDVFLNAMREISKALVTHHAAALVRDLGPGAGVDPARQQAIIKDPAKSAHVALLRQMLEGSAPAKYDQRITRAITAADRGVEWVRRRFILGEVGGEKTKISAGGLLRAGKAVGKYGLVKPIAWGGKQLGRAGKAVIVNPVVGAARLGGQAIAAPFTFVKNNPGTTAAAVAAAIWFPPALIGILAYRLATAESNTSK